MVIERLEFEVIAGKVEEFLKFIVLTWSLITWSTNAGTVTTMRLWEEEEEL